MNPRRGTLCQSCRRLKQSVEYRHHVRICSPCLVQPGEAQ